MIRASASFAALFLLSVALASCGGLPGATEPTRALAPARAPASPFLLKFSGTGAVPKQAIVVLRIGAVESDFMNRYQLVVLETVTIGDVTYRLVEAQGPIKGDDLALWLEKDRDVTLATPNRKMSAPEFEGDPMSFDDGGNRNHAQGYAEQDLLVRIRAQEAHDLSRGAGVRVAILDTGLDFGHPEVFKGPVVPGRNYSVVPHSTKPDESFDRLDNDSDGRDDEAYGHGTHVAGIVRLAAPSATLIAIKVLDDEGWGTCFGLAAGIVNALQLEAGIINMSLGLTDFDPMVAHAVAYAAEHGVGVVASAGNKGSDVIQYPAGFPEAFSVTAVDTRDVLAPFANRGSKVAIAAPGVDVISWMARGTALGDYAAGDGTSMAAPFLAGAAALVMSNEPGLDGRTAAGRVVAAATPIDEPSLPGRGRVDLAAAIGVNPEMVPKP